ncbi:MAG TPA: PGF-pre-PGF domain-containing protein [Methanosarcinaceae archaeon]|nr:PGF-pre-PGF domain-containing protein [Methanosarcinaceae archaeon]
MRYSVLILLFVVLICINAVGIASAQTLVIISPSTQQIDEGKNFVISVYVGPDAPVSGAQFNLQFDSSLVNVVSVTEGNFFNQDGGSTIFNSGTIDNSQGTITDVYALIIGKSNATTPGIFANINMVALNQSGICTFEMSNVVISNSDGQSLPITVTNGNAGIGDVTVTPTNGDADGGGGGGTSGEEFENIELKEVADVYVTVNTTISYKFDNPINPIAYVNYTALNNAGSISTTIEVLKSTSALVSSVPSGKVYKNMNIWVGLFGYANEANIKDNVVGFKVTRTWLHEYNILQSTVRLNRYTSGAWQSLPTTKTSEDKTYVYFESKTPGFSSFAITGQSSSDQAISMGDIQVSTTTKSSTEVSDEALQTESQEPSTSEETPADTQESIPFIGSGIVLSFFAIAAILISFLQRSGKDE